MRAISAERSISDGNLELQKKIYELSFKHGQKEIGNIKNDGVSASLLKCEKIPRF